jgi:hypothetical protein
VCFSAAANFVGSAVLGGIGVVTLTKVKHRRELLFAALPSKGSFGWGWTASFRPR